MTESRTEGGLSDGGPGTGGAREGAGTQAEGTTGEQGEVPQHLCPSDRVTSCEEGSESHRWPEASSSSRGYQGSRES